MHIDALLEKKDVPGICCQKVSGKSLINQLVSLLLNDGERCHVIVVSAWKKLSEKQVLELNEFGIAAVAIGESQ